MMSGSKAPDTIIIEERQNRRKDIMKIGFIGLGNMATAMIGGMLQKGIAAPEDIIGSARTETTVEKVKTKFNINTTTDNKIVAAQADILFLAVKPIFFPEVIDQIKDVVAEDTLIVSIAAGRTLDYLKEAFGRPELKLIRCMPNTPALVLEGCTGVCAEENVTEEDMEQVLALLRSFGIASVVPERLMDVVVGLIRFGLFRLLRLLNPLPIICSTMIRWRSLLSN
jgi:pyrroline-5-carboxylate reductase